jgi:transcriptional regulator with XRE-family HTH domain
MAHKLQNYLRTYRKRTGLSQDEVAFLLGCQGPTGGAKVSRYERFSRKPSLETALAYEAVFGIPGRELFAGIFQKVEEKTKKRAQLLARKLNGGKPDRMTRRKLETLASISSGSRIGPLKDS